MVTYFMVKWFCLFDVWTSYFGIMSQYDATFDLKINVGHCDLYFSGPVILPDIVKTTWYMNTIPWDYDSVWPDVWPQNICQTLWPIFHGQVILPYTLKTICCMNIILWDYESVCSTFDLKINVGHCDLYFMVQWFCLISWRLLDIWTPYYGIMIQYDLMFDLKIFVQTLWPVFHGQVILPYILKTYLMYENHTLDGWVS